jgi:hypothetical protein
MTNGPQADPSWRQCRPDSMVGLKFRKFHVAPRKCLREVISDPILTGFVLKTGDFGAFMASFFRPDSFVFNMLLASFLKKKIVFAKTPSPQAYFEPQEQVK